MGGEVPEPRRLSRALSFGCGGVPNEALHLVMGYVDDPRDREAASLVCRRWHRIDALTRKHVTVAFCYAADPSRLRARFPRLESLALKGRPRASMYGLIPEDWGAYAAPWVAELAAPLECLKALHLRRMTVTDADLAALVRARGHMLQELKLDKCSGFSTDALRLVARSCRGKVEPRRSSLAFWIRKFLFLGKEVSQISFHTRFVEVIAHKNFLQQTDMSIRYAKTVPE